MRSRLFPPVFVAAVLAMGFLAYNLYYAPFMKNLALWTLGVLVIYWFSVSGGMHNIIRGVPMYYPDQDGKVKVCSCVALYQPSSLCNDWGQRGFPACMYKVWTQNPMCSPDA